MRNPKGIQSECLPIDPVLVWYSHSLSCIPGGWVNPCSRGGNGQACKALQGQAPVAVSGLRLLGAERCEHAGEACQATKNIGALSFRQARSSALRRPTAPGASDGGWRWRSKGEHDVMMLRHGAHCGLAQTYFADEDIFETLDDLDRKTSTSTARGR